MEFINEVFIPFDPHNHAIYTPKQISTKDIFLIVSGCTNYFDDKNIKSFTTWCSKKKKNLNFFKAEEVRKKQKTESDAVIKRVRLIYVMKEEEFLGNVKLPALQKVTFKFFFFIDKAVLIIKDQPPHYKAFMTSLEEEGYELIGYLRKSKGKEKEDVRIRLLETMAIRLIERCPVKAVYAFPFSNSMDKIASRDLCKESKSLVKQLNNVSGSAQDMMNHIKAANTNICLIVIDFAGLSRDSKDIRSFLRSHPKLKKKNISGSFTNK
ncbi:hypothetical protein BD770DRAFT_358858 [Pilaira anomala]|nr:hypothetical protein BD770DRAFT_358858 [Pilaira anomala]